MVATAPAIKMEDGGVQIISRRMVKPEYQKSSLSPDPEIVHLTPWDLRMLPLHYAQKGVVLPKPPASVHAVEDLASSFAPALGRFYPLTGRFTVAKVAKDGDGTPSPQPGPGLTISLRCSDEGAEFVHAVAPGVTVADITGTLCIPRVVWSLFPLNGMLGMDAVVDPSLPVLAAQVTELADGLFVGMSLNHGVADGFTFWDLFKEWSEINRNGGAADGDISTVPPPKRWFMEGSTVPIPLPFHKVEDIARQFECPAVHECSIHFSPESVKKLKAKANAEMAGTATATISSLQAVLAHLWRATCRARGLTPDQDTICMLAVACRTRLKSLPPVYMGNAGSSAAARAAVSEILDEDRLGWAAWLLNRAVAAVDEASMRENLQAWHENPIFKGLAGRYPPEAMVVIGSRWFDVYGNDFGWGRPVGVRTGAGNKVDGKVTVFESRDDGGGRGGLELQVCLAPDVLTRLVADQELMNPSI